MNSYRILCFAITFLMLWALRSGAQVSALESMVIYSTEGNSTVKDSMTLFTVKEIVITGNKQTRNATVLREVSFKVNEQYHLNELIKQFAQTKKQLMNTGLFQEAIVSLQSFQGLDATVKIDVKERWYIFPIPFVRMVDRSFGEWVNEQHMDLKRINYGINITHNNITGRADKLHVYLMNGYTKQVALSYDNLYLDKKLQWSSNFGVALGQNKEINYITVNNKLQAIKNSNDFLRSYFRSYLEFNYRKAIKTTHTIGIAYNFENIADTIFKLNPEFSSQKHIIRYPEINYRLTYFNTDFNPYPLKGYVAEMAMSKKGFNHQMNLWQLIAKGSAYWPLSGKYFFNASAAGGLKLPFKQPYVSQQLVGYNDLFMQGYEYYIIDGVAGGYTKANLSRQIVNTIVHIPSERIKRLNNIPVRIYAKVYGNTGYVYNPQPGDNGLCNRLLYSGGFGLDIVTFYDFIVKLEWSFNQLGQNGIYLHRKSYF